jgi:hypothetical protein
MSAAVSRRLDDEGLPLPPPVHGRVSGVFVRGLQDLVLAPAHEAFQVTVTRAVNSVLFIVVILELLRTIVARLDRA